MSLFFSFNSSIEEIDGFGRWSNFVSVGTKHCKKPSNFGDHVFSGDHTIAVNIVPYNLVYFHLQRFFLFTGGKVRLNR